MGLTGFEKIEEHWVGVWGERRARSAEDFPDCRDESRLSYVMSSKMLPEVVVLARDFSEMVDNRDLWSV
jgi:hypothetical protein